MTKEIKDWEKEFDEKFPPVSQWSSRNGDYTETPIPTLKSFISHLLSQQRDNIKKEVEGMKSKLPWVSKLCQNRNGIEYCGMCEQAWELCSCSARNTGHVKALSHVLTLLDKTK